MNWRNRRSERGFNLIEVLIAIALLGTVTLTIVTLFYMGRSNVYAGKQMSHAVAIGTNVMEDLNGKSKADILTTFNAVGATIQTIDVDTTRVQPHDTYANSVLRKSTVADDIDPAKNDPQKLMIKWRDKLLAGASPKSGPYVAVVLTPSHPNPTTDPLTIDNATMLRVRVLVRWREGARYREVILDSVKPSRP